MYNQFDRKANFLNELLAYLPNNINLRNLTQIVQAEEAVSKSTVTLRDVS